MAYGRYGIDPETGYSLCKQGHTITPDNATPKGSCKKCKLAYMTARNERLKAEPKCRKKPRRVLECAYCGCLFLVRHSGGKLYCSTHCSKMARSKYHPYVKKLVANREKDNSPSKKAKNKAFFAKMKADPNYKELKKQSKLRAKERLADWFVAKTLGVPVSVATPELLEIKRLSMQIKRSLKNDNQIRENHNNNGACTGAAC